MPKLSLQGKSNTETEFLLQDELLGHQCVPVVSQAELCITTPGPHTTVTAHSRSAWERSPGLPLTAHLSLGIHTRGRRFFPSAPLQGYVRFYCIPGPKTETSCLHRALLS